MNNIKLIEYLKKLLTENLEKTVEEINEIVEKVETDKYFQNDVVHVTSRLNSINDDLRKNIIDREYANIEKARIRQTIIHIIDKLGQFPELNNKSANQLNNNKMTNNSHAIITSDIEAELKKLIDEQNEWIEFYLQKISVAEDPPAIKDYELKIKACEKRKKIFEKQTQTQLILEHRNIEPQIIETELHTLIKRIDKHYNALSKQLEGAENRILNHFDEQIQVVLLPEIEKLSEKDTRIMELLLKDIEQNKDSFLETNQYIALLLDTINDLKVDNKEKVKEKLNDADIAVKHKLKISIPLLIPFLKYEGEVELSAKEKFPTTWKEFKALFFKTNNKVKD